MKNLYAGLLAGLLLTGAAQAQEGWRPTGGPSGQTINTMVSQNGLLFAGIDHTINTDNGGVYRSADQGRSWKWITGAATGFHANGWPYAPDTRKLLLVGTALFAATNQGVFYSADNGTTWEARNAGLTGAAFDVRSITRTPNGNLLLASWGAGIFISTDQGMTWFSTNNGLPNNGLNMIGLSAAGRRIFASANDAGLYVSTDGGQNWLPQTDSSGTAITRVVSFSTGANGRMLATGNYGGNFDGGVYYSADSGRNWKHRNGRYQTDGIPFPLGMYSSMIAPDGKLIAGTDRGLYVSADSGHTWSLDSTRGMASTAVSAILPGANAGETFVGTIIGGLYGRGGGVYHRDSPTAVWTARSIGLPSPYGPQVMKGIGHHVWAGMENATRPIHGLWTTADGGDNWTRSDAGIFNPDGAVDFAAHNGDLFVIDYGDGVSRSSDGGRTWTAINNGATSQTGQCMVVRHDTLFYGTLGNFYRSTNNGDNWNTATIGMPTSPYVYSLADVGNVLVAGMESVGILVSHNGGNSWVPSNITSGRVSVVFGVDATTALAGSNNGAALLRSTDRGATWNPITVPWNALYVLAKSVSGMTVASTDHGAAYSRDGGLTWALGNIGLNRAATEDQATYGGAMAIAGDTAYFAGESGIYRRPLSDFGAVTAAQPLHTNEKALLLYPNPAQDRTLVRFQADHADEANLELVDLTGRVIRREALVLSTGLQTVEIRLTGLAKGLYKLRLTGAGIGARKGNLVVE